MKQIPPLKQETANYTKESDSDIYRSGFSSGLVLGLILLAAFIER